VSQDHWAQVPCPPRMRERRTVLREAWVKLHGDVGKYVECETFEEDDALLEEKLKPCAGNCSGSWYVGGFMRPADATRRGDEAERPLESLPESLVLDLPHLILLPKGVLNIRKDEEIEHGE